MRLLLFIYPDSYPDMSGYINTYTVHSKRGMKDVKEYLKRSDAECTKDEGDRERG